MLPCSPLVRGGTGPCCLVALATFLPSCADIGGEEPAAPIGAISDPSFPELAQRNRIVSQPFDVALVTPNGRLALQHIGDRIRFIALRDSRISLAGGAPAFEESMLYEPGASAEIDIGALMPPSASIAGVARVGGGAPIAADSPNTPWTPQGQGALAHDPRFSPHGKPFLVDRPEDCGAATPSTRQSVVRSSARYECYRLIHFQPRGLNDTAGRFTLAVFQAPVTVAVSSYDEDPQTGTLVRSPAPRVVLARYAGDFELSRSRSGEYHWALEANTTADGRLLVTEGGFWAFSETPWLADGWTSQRRLSELYAAVRGDVEGLRWICRSLDASGAPSCAPDSEEAFDEVFPIARRPLTLADGRPIAGGFENVVHCGYPWITPEGTDVFCRVNPRLGGTAGLELLAGFESSTGMQTVVFGQRTGWTIQRLDGGINTRRFNPDRVEPSGGDPNHRPFSPVFLNSSSGFWAAGAAPGATRLPFRREPAVFQFMSKNWAITSGLPSRAAYQRLGLVDADTTVDQYWEVSFACSSDPSCLVHLPMNEAFYDAGDPGALRALPVTADHSANVGYAGETGQNRAVLLGRLEGGATFAAEIYRAGEDERLLSGYRGTAIGLDQASAISVEVANDPGGGCSLWKGCLGGESYRSGFTATLAALPLDGSAGASYPLVRHHGLFEISVAAGELRATVSYRRDSVAQALVLAAPWPAAISSVEATPADQAERWVHIALRADPRAGEASLLVDGEVAATAELPADASLRAAAAPGGELMRLGPAGDCSGCAGGQLALFIDELQFFARALPEETIDAIASTRIDRPDVLTPASARQLLAGYFARRNPESLTLLPDGFPRFVDERELHLPAELAPFVGRPEAFERLVLAGELLFSSPLLSTDASGSPQRQRGTGELLSCATCHDPARAFTDGRSLAIGVDATDLNTPTIVNRAFATRQFFDQRSADLVAQALQPVVNPMEMNGDLPSILQALNGSPIYAPLARSLRDTFGVDAVRAEHLELALVAFQSVQLRVDSLADHIVATHRSVTDPGGRRLSPDLVRVGADLFAGKARCTSCHGGPNFSDELTHDTGVSAAPRAFKTPTLWDIADTGPYFHDGSQPNLAAVIDFYNRGGDRRGTSDPEMRPLGLTRYERAALESYLLALRNVSSVQSQIGAAELTFSHSGPIPGLFCVQLRETADPGPWSDNYLCSASDLGIRWSSAGPIAGMRCAAITEGAEPPETTWNDNFLCVPPDSALDLTWYSAGRPRGRACTSFDDPDDPHTWADNFLCQSQPLQIEFSAAGPLSGMACTPMIELADLGGGWNDNYVCANKDIGLQFRSYGEIDGMRCTQIAEYAEPAGTTWLDNYLCVPADSNVELAWSMAGPLSGRDCVFFNEPQDPHTWADNYLCFSEARVELAFSAAGPIDGMTCAGVIETADVAGGWNDNYLCSNVDLGIRWSSAGPIDGMRCTQIAEGAEPPETTWWDNYLCVPDTSPLDLAWSMAGPLGGRTCVAFAEPQDPNTWADNFLCY